MLVLFGALALLSAIFGISSFPGGSQGLAYGKYSGLLQRGAAGIYGGLLLYLALGIHRRNSVAWKAGLFLLPVFWIGFVAFGSLAVAARYPKQSDRDTLLFAAMLAAVSLPVLVYWQLRWIKQKGEFSTRTQIAGEE